jgi:outer membrane protein assembly factor BamA
MNNHLKLTSASRSLVPLLLILCAGTAHFAHAQKPNSGHKIAKIEVEGLHRLSAEEVIGTSGLKPGQPFAIEDVDLAAQRLADSGLFKKVSYRARTDGNLATIIFEVEEGRSGNSPVIFDNFIWFTDAELVESVRREVPSFSGNAPDAGQTINAISRSLQKFLKEHDIEATVDYMSSQDAPGSSKQDHIFSVTGISMPICTLHFPGAINVPETKLIASSKELSGTDYSRKVASVFAVASLFPIYREVGQLKASFGAPAAKPDDETKCKGGVDVTIPVTEGSIYSWEKVVWSGNQVLSAEELNTVLGMKTGEVANGIKFDKGMREVAKAYGRKGYIEAGVRSEPTFDDAEQRVTYQVEIREGPQYRMGNLIVKGFSQSSEKLLRAKWPLKSGDVFNDENQEEFRRKSFNEVMRKVGEEYYAEGKALPKKVDISRQPHKTTLTVDVTIELGN